MKKLLLLFAIVVSTQSCATLVAQRDQHVYNGFVTIGSELHAYAATCPTSRPWNPATANKIANDIHSLQLQLQATPGEGISLDMANDFITHLNGIRKADSSGYSSAWFDAIEPAIDSSESIAIQFENKKRTN